MHACIAVLSVEALHKLQGHQEVALLHQLGWLQDVAVLGAGEARQLSCGWGERWWGMSSTQAQHEHSVGVDET